ncbi:DUF4129 domain-containing protein [Haloferax sp. MBLA0077]|uniref:DUF4129 domain-containing protein n=2 Tax=Haloferax TaxID=2251 RepID=A0A6G1Z108_9EURY|nr:DUF4129 domain-containing protein [Haloferax sp. CBA1149]MRW80202.1 DUF4129 domain-containing protein [Haloferax marinisediminis]
MLSAVSAPVVAAPTDSGVETDDSDAPKLTAPGAPYPLQQQTTPENSTNNSSDVLHENPDEVDDENELDRLLSYLSGRMNSNIGTSTLQLSQGQYDAAKAALGDDYSTSLGKYVDVQGETDEEGAGDQYETVQETQREYVDTVQEFRETQRAYRAAKQAGNDARARELARKLTQLADEGETQTATLVTTFATISNETGSDLSESQAQLESIQANISDQRDEIVALEFTDTRITVEPYDRNISFTDPLFVSGTLETANGTPVETTDARFTIGEQTIRAPIDSDGSFTFTYRPTRVPANASNLTLRYQPVNSSVYRPTQRGLPVSITQVDATAEIAVPTNSTYGYADSLAVDVLLLVDGSPVEQFPVTASLGRTRLSSSATAETGRATLDGTVPASASVGDVTIRVAPDSTTRAVSFTPVTEQVRITSEQTSLDATAQTSEGQTVVVEGALTTEDGDAVSDQPLTVRVGTRTVETTTGASGAYRTTIERPADVSTENATVTVVFDGDDTNLESTSTTVAVQHSTAGGASGNGTAEEGSLPFALLDALWVVAGAGLVGLATVVLLRRRTDDTTEVVETDSPSPSDEGVDTETPPSTESIATNALTSARELLSAGNPNDAVVVAYTGMRHSLASVADIDDSATHWEFSEQCAEAGVGDADALTTLTAGYETAAYSGRTVDTDEAEALVDTAEALVDATEAP